MKLPVLKPKIAIKKLQKAGFEIDHQTGSHVILLNSATGQRVTVAYHNKDIKRKTIHNIIKQSALGVKKFNQL